jgi:hypothetical protein
MAIFKAGRATAGTGTSQPGLATDTARIAGPAFAALGAYLEKRVGASQPASAGQDSKPKAAVASSTKTKGGTETQAVATQPMLRYVLFGLICLGAGLGFGVLLQQHYHPGMRHLPVLAASFGAFALLYVLAQAIERLLVPVSWFGGGFLGGLGNGRRVGRSKSTLAAAHQSALVRAYTQPSPETAKDAANTQHDLDQYRANLTATTFGLAALAAMLVSGYAGVFMLHIVGLDTVAWLDLLVTGLAIAGGTKPLHDLISNISSGAKAKK